MSTAPMLGLPGTRSVLVSATPFVRRQLVAQRAVARVLGRLTTALYLELDQGAVIAVLTSDAIALPIGLILPTSSGQMPLDRPDLDVAIDEGTVKLGDLLIVAARERSARAELAGEPSREHLARALGCLTSAIPRLELAVSMVHDVTRARSSEDMRRAVRALLGRGPGLTPAGDDALCGVLAGAVFFGRDAADVRRAVLTEIAERPRATTSLSRQLLERACDGEAIPEVAKFARALCADAPLDIESITVRLLGVGHSSGAALAYGVLSSCELP